MTIIVMVAIGLGLLVAGLTAPLIKKRREALLPAADEELSLPDAGDLPGEDTEPEEIHHLFFDPLTREPVAERAATVYMTVLSPSGKEEVVAFAVNAATADRYLSRNGGPMAFAGAITDMKGDPGWCLAAIGTDGLEPVVLDALYQVMVGQMVQNGDVLGWLETLQAYWAYGTGHEDAPEDEEQTDQVEMILVHEELDRAIG